MSTVTVKEEPDDPGYYQYNIPGNDTSFHMCLSHENVGYLSIALSVPLFIYAWSLNVQLFCQDTTFPCWLSFKLF